jgi:hypothetical protein
MQGRREDRVGESLSVPRTNLTCLRESSPLAGIEPRSSAYKADAIDHDSMLTRLAQETEAYSYITPDVYQTRDLKVDFHQRDLCRATKSRDVTCFHLQHLSRDVTC